MANGETGTVSGAGAERRAWYRRLAGAALRRLGGRTTSTTAPLTAPVVIAPVALVVPEEHQLAGAQLRLRELEHELAVYRSDRAALTERIPGAPRKEAKRLADHDLTIQWRMNQLAAERDALRERIASAAAADADGFIVMPRAITELADAITAGEWARAETWRDRIVGASPLWLEHGLWKLNRAAAPAGRLDMLFDLLANGPPATLSRLRLIARAMAIGVELGRERDVAQIVADAHARVGADYVRFGSADHITVKATGLDRDRRAQIASIKYKDIPLAPEAVFAAAELLAERIDPDPALIDHLAAIRSDQLMPRAEWERRFRIATCIDHLTHDRPRPVSARPGRSADYSAHIDMSAANRVFDQLDATRGALILWSHGGLYHEALKGLFERFPDAIIMGITYGGRLPPEQVIAVKDDPGLAMFRAVRAVTEGKVVIMAPDGHHGNRSHFVEMAGRTVRSAIGGAVIAHETGCQCAFYAMLPVGRRFTGFASIGPQSEPGERLDSYAHRWLAFYWGQMAAIFTGDPERMTLGRQWSMLTHWER